MARRGPPQPTRRCRARGRRRSTASRRPPCAGWPSRPVWRWAWSTTASRTRTSCSPRLPTRIVDSLVRGGRGRRCSFDERPGPGHGAARGHRRAVGVDRGHARRAVADLRDHHARAAHRGRCATVAEHQYAVSQAASEALLSLAATASGATWTRPVAELAAEALAFVDGVTLRWLVDGDGAAARARLDAFSATWPARPRLAPAAPGAAPSRADEPSTHTNSRDRTDRARMTDLDGLTTATAHLDPPLAALDLAALQANAADLVRRAAGKPVRVASKSVRCRHVLDLALATPGFGGVMGYSLREAIWLVRSGVRDVLIGYPTRGPRRAGRTGRPTRARRGDHADGRRPGAAAAHPGGRRHGTAAGLPGRRRVAADRPRAPRRAALAAAHARPRRRRWPAIARTEGFRVVGVMFYEAQIAGLPDSSPAVRLVKQRSAAELAVRRGAGGRRGRGRRSARSNSSTPAARAASRSAPTTRASPRSPRAPGCTCRRCSTTTARSQPRPSLYFALPVVRRPARGIATLFGGGYVASGPAGSRGCPSRSRRGLQAAGHRGRRRGADAGARTRRPRGLQIGDRVWFRHAKAGEMLRAVRHGARRRRRARSSTRCPAIAARARTSAERHAAQPGALATGARCRSSRRPRTACAAPGRCSERTGGRAGRSSSAP